MSISSALSANSAAAMSVSAGDEGARGDLGEERLGDRVLTESGAVPAKMARANELLAEELRSSVSADSDRRHPSKAPCGFLQSQHLHLSEHFTPAW
eukprot:scaffold50749_cov25-Tisochrysis_lutea.AAC.4